MRNQAKPTLRDLVSFPKENSYMDSINEREGESLKKARKRIQISNSEKPPAQNSPKFSTTLELFRQSMPIEDTRPRKQRNLPDLEHKFQKIRDKLNVPGPQQYYESLPIKPGLFFLDSLIKAPRAQISSLELNIPESLYRTDKQYYICTLDSGKLHVTTEMNSYKFLRLLEAHRKSPNEFELPLIDRAAAVMRVMDEQIQDIRNVVMD